MYKILRNFLFLFPAETAHALSMNLLKTACSLSFVRKWLKNTFFPGEKMVHVFGLEFRNPIGLGAGFDKNAMYLRELDVLGFGFVEVGTVTPKPQEGNGKPRLFRLKKDQALINRMGFNNDGAEAVAERLKKWKEKTSIMNREPACRQAGRESSMEKSLKGTGRKLVPPMIVAGNIGKNKSTPNEEAWKDYEKCFITLHPYVDFFVVNVSSPNTPGLRALQDKDSLRKILVNLQENNRQFEERKPLLLKIAPDLELAAIDDVIDLAKEIQLDGIVATNTTISRDGLKTAKKKVEEIGPGGLSGLPLKEKSTSVVQYIQSKLKGSIPIIASGGVFDASGAKAKFENGATLIEVWTGFIYEGPFIVKAILTNRYKH
jgi:dihydroorotate dehydrogenase